MRLRRPRRHPARVNFAVLACLTFAALGTACSAAPTGPNVGPTPNATLRAAQPTPTVEPTSTPAPVVTPSARHRPPRPPPGDPTSPRARVVNPAAAATAAAQQPFGMRSALPLTGEFA